MAVATENVIGVKEWLRRHMDFKMEMMNETHVPGSSLYLISLLLWNLILNYERTTRP